MPQSRKRRTARRDHTPRTVSPGRRQARASAARRNRIIAAVVVFALVARFARRPIWLFRRIALVALLLSFIPDLALPFMPGPDPVGPREIVLLALTHVVAAAVSVALLTTLARDPSR